MSTSEKHGVQEDVAYMHEYPQAAVGAHTYAVVVAVVVYEWSSIVGAIGYKEARDRPRPDAICPKGIWGPSYFVPVSIFLRNTTK